MEKCCEDWIANNDIDDGFTCPECWQKWVIKDEEGIRYWAKKMVGDRSK